MFADVIKKERIKTGLSQRELGLRVGVTQQAIGRWENGQALPDTNTLIQLADLFHTSIDYLLDRQSSVDSSELANNRELLAFWLEVKNRPDLQTLLSYIRSISPKVAKQLLDIIKILQDEEKGR